MYVYLLNENQNISHLQTLHRANLPSEGAMILLIAGTNSRVTDDSHIDWATQMDGLTHWRSVCQSVDCLTKHSDTSKSTHSPRSVRRLLYACRWQSISDTLLSLPSGNRNTATPKYVHTYVCVWLVYCIFLPHAKESVT